MTAALADRIAGIAREALYRAFEEPERVGTTIFFAMTEQRLVADAGVEGDVLDHLLVRVEIDGAVAALPGQLLGVLG